MHGRLLSSAAQGQLQARESQLHSAPSIGSPSASEKSRTAALILKPLDRTGAFAVVEDEVVIGYGMARISKAMPGYLTLVTTEVPLGYAIRVPVDWIAELEKLPLSEHEIQRVPETG